MTTERDHQSAGVPCEQSFLSCSVGEVLSLTKADRKRLKTLGVETVGDLIDHLPRDVQDLGDVRSIAELDPTQVQTVIGVVLDTDTREVRGGRTLTTVLIDSHGERLRGTWFNQAWIRTRFADGQHVAFSGKPKQRRGFWEMSHPKVQWADEEDGELRLGVECVYPLTEGLKPHRLREWITTVLPKAVAEVIDPLPASFCEEHDLLTISEAYRWIHQPASVEHWQAARRRLVYDDLFEFQLALALRRRAWRLSGQSPVLSVTPQIDARIRRLFPFEFTNGQNSAIKEVCADIAEREAMHRLLQADVGAGKTVVAVYALLTAIANGRQAAFMAPTEVLAEQHWRTLDALLAESRVDRQLLTGSLTPAQRRAARERIASGEAQLVVGTQALIQEGVTFRDLGLVVIDEQHKFGVLQRSRFSSEAVVETEAIERTKSLFVEPANVPKPDNEPDRLSPHVLVMTATPIPRSLCLTQFGDLDVTRMTDRPPGRQPIVTSLVTTRGLRDKMLDFIREQLRSGRQAYVVCPRVEEGEESDLVSVGRIFRELSEGPLADFRVGMVHGRMSGEEKARGMDDFRMHRLDVLVSTTVIEVGVDVPNATLMAIYQADWFGLSQLHQLRGRIGRGAFQGYCFLLTKAGTAAAAERLEAMVSTTDGFRLAEVDFELRGPGDVLGTRQHGDLPLRRADLTRDAKLLTKSRREAFALVKQGAVDRPEFARLRGLVLERFGERMQLPKGG